MVISGGAIAFLVLSTVSIRVLHPVCLHRVVGRGDLAGGLGRRDPHYRDLAGPGRGTGRTFR